MLRTDSSQQEQEVATMYDNLATEDCFNKDNVRAELKNLNLRQVIVMVTKYTVPDHTLVQP